jgi:cytochrome c-type biogenesis protein CcsB
MTIDQTLIVIAISSYIVGTIAFFTYLLSREPLAQRIGVPFAILGCTVQFGELVYRYASSHIWPLTNLYGSLSLFAAMSVAIFIGFALKYRAWFLGGPVLAFAAGFLAYALTWNEGYLPAVPALQSYWIKIHVPLVVSSYAAFLVACAVSIVYLIRYYAEKSLDNPSGGLPAVAGLTPASATGTAANLSLSKTAAQGGMALSPSARSTAVVAQAAERGSALAQWLTGLPSLAQLDILTYRVVAVGLPLLSIGIITGAWWAKEAWGAYWQWDPKETAALFSWTVYALYMHLHTRSTWRGLRCAWLSVFGFVSIIFCYLGVNIWISGLHSYKM